MGRVAILAVHGIGKHLAGETQDAVADLLMSLPARGPYGAAREYQAFTSVGLQIPLQPVVVPVAPGPPAVPPFAVAAKKKRLRNIYEEESAGLAKEVAQAGQMNVGDVNVRYTDRLLRQYQGGADGNIYKTTRLEGRRLGGRTREVDIYEILWSDLAKPDNSFVVFFLSLFQLIMHLGSLSRLAIDSGAAEGTDRIWWLYRKVQRYAVRLLQIFIPLLEVVLLVAVGSCMPRVLAGSGSRAMPLALGAVFGMVTGMIVIRKATRRVSEGPWLWSLRALVPVGLGLGLPILIMHCFAPQVNVRVRADVAGAILSFLVVGAGLMWWILDKYDDHRNGAVFTGWLLGAMGFCFYVYFLWVAYHHLGADKTSVVLLATLWTAEVLLSATRLCWAVMILFAILASILGGVAWRRMKAQAPAADGWGRARAAVRTSRLALALPAVLFMLVTMVIWAGVVKATNEAGPNAGHAPLFTPLAYETPPPWFVWGQEHKLLPPPELAECNARYLRPAKTEHDPPTMDYAMRILAWGIGYQIPVVLGLVALTAFLLLWWALPSVLTESTVPRGEEEPPRDTQDEVSIRMGTWMSRGLDATAVLTLLLWISVFAVSPAYQITLRLWPKIADVLGPVTFSALNYPVVGFGLLAVLATRGRTVLSTILDVDTYLRTTPITATPRAMIFERYVSTLRYVQQETDSQGNPVYDKIVILAHSLGALISCDLLLYLQHQRNIEPAYLAWSRPITLMTMGNPARQLLNRFFPYLYDWIRALPDNGAGPLPQAMRQPPPPPPAWISDSINNGALPDPARLGVAHWVNAYRSGDYVGRSLWLDEWYHRPAHPALARVLSSPNGTRSEFCIGSGAHTRYMDDSAPDIAYRLDQLI